MIGVYESGTTPDSVYPGISQKQLTLPLPLLLTLTIALKLTLTLVN